MRTWDNYLSDQDLQVASLSGFGSAGSLGRNIALLIIDVTYGFCGDKREPILDSVHRFRNSSGEIAWRAVDQIEMLIQSARCSDVDIIYTRGMSTATTMSPGRWASKNSRAFEDTEWHHEIVEPLSPQPEDIVLRKTKPSAFFGTPLASILVERNIDSLIVCGTTTSGCVRATVVDAFSYNYAVAVVEEGCFDRIQASHAMNLFDMNLKYADVIGLDDATGILRDTTVTPVQNS